MDVSDVARLPEIASVGLGAPHVTRVEHALYDQAVGGMTWKDTAVAGDVVRLQADRRPDVSAAKLLLAAHVPERYGQLEPVRAPPAPLSITVQFVSASGQRLDAIDVVPEPTPATQGGYPEIQNDRGV